MSTNRTPADMEEDGGEQYLRYRTIADLLNEPDGLRYSSTSPPGSLSAYFGRGGAGPASEEAIEALKDVAAPITGDVHNQQPPAECVICLHQGDAAAGWKEMPCEHRFHGGCLERWLRVHGTCPMCRHLMPTAEEEEEEEMEEVVGVMSDEADGGPMESRVVLLRSSGSGGGGVD